MPRCSARRATEWLDALAETWQKTDPAEEKADVIHAVYERIVVEGARFVGLRLTPAPCRTDWRSRFPRCYCAPDRIRARSSNQVETWFSILSRQAIRRGAFRSVKELVARIEAFIANWNAGASPSVWVKSADEILAKAVRKPRATNEP